MHATDLQSLAETLRALGEEANELADGYLNCGGCCVFAAIVARKLHALGVDVRGRVADWGRGNVDKARRKVRDPGNTRDWNENGVGFNHVGLELRVNGERYLYDSDGLERVWPFRTLNLPAGDWPVIRGSLSVGELEALADGGCWNSMFDRELIPELESMADRAFSHFHA